jgi:SRSO17 transposase
MLPGERKSVEPMAARTAPARTAAQHQSLLHFVANAAWSDHDVLAKVREMVLPAIEKNGPIEAWIIDDTSFPKQGKHSGGVHHQYCGQIGKQANCQVAVSLSIANHSASLPVAYRLYLPQEWTKDRARRKKVGVPKQIKFKTKPEIAMEQIRWACESGLPRGVALMDAAYGRDSRLRAGMTELDVSYVVGIVPTILMWAPGSDPRLSPEWLLIEWPEGEKEPTKHWLSTLPQTISFQQLVDFAKLRWRIERDYQELKQEVGLGHYEGRGWRGFHHHATLCIAAYGFLIVEQATSPPSGPRSAAPVQVPPLPDNYRTRGPAFAA